VDRGFVDTQESGPFAFWQHRHTFRTISENRTEIIDEVQAETGAHPFWGIVSRIMWLNLPFMFAYRAWITRRQVERTGVQNTRVEA
jgi:ligand-binding SRPBCC domain-containing protein